MFRIKFPTKIIFPIFPILKTGGIVPFCKLIYWMTLVCHHWANIFFLTHPCSWTV